MTAIPLVRPRHRWFAMLPGLGLSVALAAAATLVSPRLCAAGLVASPMVVALLLGLGLAQLRPLPAAVLPGLAFACRPLLRFAIVLLGLRIGLPQVAALGTAGLLRVAAIVVGTLAAGYGISRRLGLSKDLAWLLASGHAICGAAAIAAADSVLQAKEREVTQALTLVTLFGTIVMLLFPVLGGGLAMAPKAYGFWVGGAVHEVAQAVAAGFARGESCGEAASLVKMVRVAFVLPLGLGLGVLVARRGGHGQRGKIVVPWFVCAFAAVAGLDAAGLAPERLADPLRWLCSYTMTVAMGALGLKSSLREVAAAGARPLIAAALTTTCIGALSFGLALHST